MKKFSSLTEVDEEIEFILSQMYVLNSVLEDASAVDKIGWQNKKSEYEREYDALKEARRDFLEPKKPVSAPSLFDEPGAALELMIEQIDVLQKQNEGEASVADMERRLDFFLSDDGAQMPESGQAESEQSADMDGMLELFIQSDIEQKPQFASGDVSDMDGMLELFLTEPSEEIKSAKVSEPLENTDAEKPQVMPEKGGGELAAAELELRRALEKAEKLGEEVDEIKREAKADRERFEAELEAQRAKYQAENARKQNITRREEQESKEVVFAMPKIQSVEKKEVVETAKEPRRQAEQNCDERAENENAARIARKLAQRKSEIAQLRTGIADVKGADSAYVLREKFLSLQIGLDSEERNLAELSYLISKSMDDISHAVEVAALKRRLAIAAQKVAKSESEKQLEALRRANFRRTPRNPLHRRVRPPRD